MFQGKVDQEILENQLHTSITNNRINSNGVDKKSKIGICKNKTVKNDIGIIMDMIGIKSMFEKSDMGIIILKVCANIKKLPQKAAKFTRLILMNPRISLFLIVKHIS